MPRRGICLTFRERWRRLFGTHACASLGAHMLLCLAGRAWSGLGGGHEPADGAVIPPSLAQEMNLHPGRSATRARSTRAGPTPEAVPMMGSPPLGLRRETDTVSPSDARILRIDGGSSSIELAVFDGAVSSEPSGRRWREAGRCWPTLGVAPVAERFVRLRPLRPFQPRERRVIHTDEERTVARSVCLVLGVR